MIPRLPRPHGSTPDHDAPAAGEEAPRAPGGAGATALTGHSSHPGVGPEGTGGRSVALDAPRALRLSATALRSPHVRERARLSEAWAPGCPCRPRKAPARLSPRTMLGRRRPGSGAEPGADRAVGC